MELSQRLSSAALSGHQLSARPRFKCNQFLAFYGLRFCAPPGLALPVCENLATALFIKGLQGEATEVEAWNVLEYVRQRGMVHRPEVSSPMTSLLQAGCYLPYESR